MWTKEEINFILANRNMALKDMAEHLGRSLDATRNKRHRLKASPRRQVWTDAEREILKLHYGVKSKEEVAEMLPNRTWAAIVRQACYLRERQWGIGKY
jgi:hypothetical protein